LIIETEKYGMGMNTADKGEKREFVTRQRKKERWIEEEKGK